MTSRPRTLDALVDNERMTAFAGYSPESVTRLLDLCGNPHRALACAHIAGTNGKGSTAHYLHAILTAAGYRTGLYTSPHLLRINERIRIGGVEISDADLARYTAELFDLMEGRPDLTPTWFDALTFIAFRYFRERGVDFAVIETGLGGRLDSTNVVSPLVSVITSVGLDHTHILGTAIPEIAREKAGIVKPGVPVVTACGGEALEVIADAARHHSSPLHVYGKDFFTVAGERGPAGRRFDYAFDGGMTAAGTLVPSIAINDIAIPQTLPVQEANAAMAITAAELMTADDPLPENAVRRALRDIAIPGRFERLLEKPLIYFDPAHNPAALEELLDALGGTDRGGGRAAVVHFMADKDVSGMLRIIQNKLTNRIFYVISGGSRSWAPDPETAGKGGMILSAGGAELAAALRALGDDTLILFTGSFRLYETALLVTELLKVNHRGTEDTEDG